jgi:light-regulated signal transduction histidine kinase (bacteriophytochrome)
VDERTAELANANQELESFSFSVSHDLRAPLRAIDGFSKILSNQYVDQFDEQGRQYFQLIQNSTRRMSQLIDDLLTLSRTSRQRIHKQAVSPTELVNKIWDQIQPEIPDRQIEIHIGEMPTCFADPSLLEQVFVNLIANALKFTKQESLAKIEVDGHQQDNEIIFMVKDNGVGFDMKYGDRLFHVFQRLHHDEDFEGTGVGLANVQRIVQRHEGRVWAEAEIGQGAVFFFSLPVIKSQFEES